MPGSRRKQGPPIRYSPMRTLLFALIAISYSTPSAAAPACIPDPKAAGERICDLYNKHGDTRTAPFAAEARACVEYYEASFKAFNELCGFHQEAEAANARIEAAARRIADNKAPADQASLEKAQADLLADAARVFSKNHTDLLNALLEMEKTYGKYSQALWSSGDFIYSQWARELYCHGGYRSEVPGFWLDGINRAMSKQVKIDHPRMTSAVLEAIRVAYLGGRGAGRAAEAARIASRGMGAVQPPSDAPTIEPSGSRTPPRDPYFHSQMKEIPIRAGQEVVSERAIHKIHHYLPLPGWVSQALNVGSGVAFYSWKDGFDAGVVISATVSVFGLPAGVAATVAEVAIRNDLERRKFFRAWVGPHLKANPGISSRQLAENFCKELKDSEERLKKQKEEERAAMNERLRATMQANAARLRADFSCRQKILEEQQRIRQAPAESREPMIQELRRKFPQGRCSDSPQE
jgi:hypothetical protein